MKNKKIANIILITLILCFVLLALIKHYFGESLIIRMLIFIVEASLVGSIADWFAVTALFKKPLGIPIKPIIPANKKKILNGLASIVNNNLLNMNYIQKIIKGIPISDKILELFNDKTFMIKSKNYLFTHTLNLLNNFKNDETKINNFLSYIKDKAKNIDYIKEKLSKFINDNINKRFTKSIYCSIIDKAILFINNNKTYNFIYSSINTAVEKKYKLFLKIKAIVDIDKLVNAIQLETTNFLKNLKASEIKYNNTKKIILKYSNSHLKNYDLSKVWIDFMDKFGNEEHIKKLIDKLENIIIIQSENNNDIFNDSIGENSNLREIAKTLNSLIESLWEEFRIDSEIPIMLDSIIKELLLEIIENNKLEFSNFIEERITSFTDEQLSNLIQSSAEEPLQWIRINGAMLGAILGIVFFSLICFINTFINTISIRF
ncbi:MAG: DUF445 family protein [Bacillota bacterium]|nr:DUF445 family protein [Bacillota bacterium]